MIRWVTGLGINQRLAAIALLLGLIAVLSSPSSRASVDPQQITLAVQGGLDRVQPRELADWIIKGRGDYRLIDIRDETGFAAYRVPGAENVPFASIAASDLVPTEKIVLFSDDVTRAGQAWVLLKAQHFNAVYVLDRGLEGWKQDVLFPTLKEERTEADRRENERVKSVAAYFGGAARSAGLASEPLQMRAAAPAPTPTVDGPSLPSGANKPTAKKKKEGC